MWRSDYDMPPDAFAQESRAALGAGETALRRAALLRARQAREEIRRGAVCRRASRFRPTCSATCGRSSGTRSTTLIEPYPGVANLNVDQALEQAGLRRAADDAVGARPSTSRSASRSCRQRSGSARCSRGRATARSSVTRAPGTWTASERRAHQAVHRADRGRACDHLPRARPRLLRPVVQGPAVPVPGRRATTVSTRPSAIPWCCR